MLKSAPHFSEKVAKDLHLDARDVSDDRSVEVCKPARRSKIPARLADLSPHILSDEELIELTLLSAMTQREARRVSKILISKFGSFVSTVTAPSCSLKQVGYLPQGTISAIKLVHTLAIRMTHADIVDRPILSTHRKLVDYLQAVIGRNRTEQIHGVFLNSSGKLLTDERIGSGTVEGCPLYAREVAKRALELDATSVILAHNHPSGDATPSLEDVEITHEVQKVLSMFSIELFDHIIVSSGHWVSFRHECLMQEGLSRSEIVAILSIIRRK